MCFCCLFSLTGKIIGIFCLLIHIKCLVGIYFIENKSFTKRPFSNCRLLKMVFHFLKFFSFHCFCSTFVKNYIKKLSLLNVNFRNLIQDLVFSQVFRSQTSCCCCCYCPFQCNIKFGKKATFTNVSMKPFLETLWKNYLF